MSVRLYAITYEEDGDSYEAVIPEWMLPDIEEITEISIVGRLIEGHSIVEDAEPDPKDRDDKPILIKTGT